MPYTTVPTFATNQLITASDFNTYLRDNEAYLLTRPRNSIKRDNAANYTTTSTSFADVDATNLIHSMTIYGTAVLVGFTGSVDGSIAAVKLCFDVLVNGTRHASGGADGIVSQQTVGASGAQGVNHSFVILLTGLTPGAQTFKLQWKVATGTGYLLAGNGGATPQDQTPTFWAVEVG